MTLARRVASLLVSLSASLVLVPPDPGRAQSAPQESARTWVGRYEEIEEYLRSAECVRMEPLGGDGFGRCTFRPGGPVARMAWKPRPPGLYRGFFSSYRTEIAAYKLDKLLQMDMVPPTVERQIQGINGAAQLWVENVVTLKAGVSSPESSRAEWNKQMRRMRMFDALVGNEDRNVENSMRDDAWKLVLVDFTRAFRSGTALPFRSGTELPFPVDQIDGDFWDRVQKLSRKELDSRLRRWLDEDQITAILGRRENIKAEIDRLIATKGASAVVLR